MKISLVPIVLLCFIGRAFSQSHNLSPTDKTYYFKQFNFENGASIPNIFIKYVTYGTLNKAKDNAILLPSSFSASYDAYDFLIGKDKGLDTSKYFLVLTEMFSNGHSSSPSNTPEPFSGNHFPKISTTDNVHAARELLSNQFQIKKLKAVIGFSMGAQQAFQWAINFPEMVESIVAYCGTAKTYQHGIARLESAISILDMQEDNIQPNKPAPAAVTRAWALHWASWFLSQEWYKQEKYKELGYTSTEEFLNARIELSKNVNAFNNRSQALTWQHHDISMGKSYQGDIKKALASIKCKVLYMPSESDLYFPLAEAIEESKYIRDVQLKLIPSLWGHLAGAGINKADNEFIGTNIKSFLNY